MSKSLRSKFSERNKENPDASTLVNFIHVLYGSNFSHEEKLENLDLVDPKDYNGKKSKAETITFILSVK